MARHDELLAKRSHEPAFHSATDPSTDPDNRVTAGKFWVDITVPATPVLYVRNEANDAWVAVGGGGSGATTALDNLTSVAINASLISNTDNTYDLGSSSLQWKDLWTHTIKHDASSNPDLNVTTENAAGDIILTPYGGGKIRVKAGADADRVFLSFLDSANEQPLRLQGRPEFGEISTAFYPTPIPLKISAGTGEQVIINNETSLSNNKIVLLADPVDPQDAATKNYVDTSSVTLNTEQTFTANKFFTSNITVKGDGGASRLRFYDNADANQGSIFYDDSTGAIALNRTNISIIRTNSGEDPVIYFSDETGVFQANVGWVTGNLIGQIVGSSPGWTVSSTSIVFDQPATFNQSIDANSHVISNVTDPTNPQDAATKNYVDTNSGAPVRLQTTPGATTIGDGSTVTTPVFVTGMVTAAASGVTTVTVNIGGSAASNIYSVMLMTKGNWSNLVYYEETGGNTLPITGNTFTIANNDSVTHDVYFQVICN